MFFLMGTHSLFESGGGGGGGGGGGTPLGPALHVFSYGHSQPLRVGGGGGGNPLGSGTVFTWRFHMSCLGKSLPSLRTIETNTVH